VRVPLAAGTVARADSPTHGSRRCDCTLEKPGESSG
jgi:hypothetical protein